MLKLAICYFPSKNRKANNRTCRNGIVAQLKVKQNDHANDPFEDFFNDPFFNRNVRNVELTLATKPVTLEVKPLPEAGKPLSFKGAVGDLALKAK